MSRSSLQATRALVLCAVAASVTALPSSASSAASAARSLTVKDEGYLRLIKSSGSVLTDEGPAHGTIPGKVRVRFVYNGSPRVSAQITIFGHLGSIQARANGRLANPSSASPSFQGTLTITGGSGRYLHASGSGHLYGVFYRRNYAMTVQTRGALRY